MEARGQRPRQEGCPVLVSATLANQPDCEGLGLYQSVRPKASMLRSHSPRAACIRPSLRCNTAEPGNRVSQVPSRPRSGRTDPVASWPSVTQVAHRFGFRSVTAITSRFPELSAQLRCRHTAQPNLPRSALACPSDAGMLWRTHHAQGRGARDAGLKLPQPVRA
jgi:hypothetical protein